MVALLQNKPFLVGFLGASALLGALHRRFSASGSIVAVIYCLPFTFMHEMAHFTVALVTGGRPSSFSIWPKRVAGGWVLGSVVSEPTVLSATPTALAPLCWLGVGYCIARFWELRPAWLPEYSILFILYACSASCVPSWQDIRVALSHPLSLALWAAAAYALFRLAVWL